MAARAAILVTTSGCHLCEDAKAGLGEVGPEFGLSIRIVDASSSEGFALLAHHRPALLPLVLLDGDLFSVGRLPRKKLRRTLERAAVAS